MKRYALLDTDFISKTYFVQDDGGNHLIDRIMELPEYEFFCHAQIVTELNRYNADAPIWLSEKIGAQKIKSYTDHEILESLSLVRGPLACATYTQMLKLACDAFSKDYFSEHYRALEEADYTVISREDYLKKLERLDIEVGKKNNLGEINPKMDLVYQGIAIGREKQIGFILAVGGGSVIDTAKAIAVGIPYSGDVWNVLQRYETATRSLPIGTVLTAVGSGSEMSNSCVITKMPEGLKRSFDSEINIPKFSILDPHYTFSVSPRQTACGSADILSHLMERYFTQVKQADVTDRMLEGLMQTVILYAPRAMEHPEDYDARAELMWAGTLAQNGLLNTGRIGDWACHGIEHEISGEYDIPHGMGLAMITGSWMRYVYSSYPARFTQFARRVFHVDYPDYDEEHIIQEGIYRLEQFFIRLGLPVSTAQLNMSHEVMERLAEQAVYKSPTKGRFRKLTKEDLVKILEMAQGNS